VVGTDRHGLHEKLGWFDSFLCQRPKTYNALLDAAEVTAGAQARLYIIHDIVE
jgi:hypothetical protein